MVLSSEPNCYDGPLVCGSINARDPPVVSSESLESRDLTGGVMRQPRGRLLENGAGRRSGMCVKVRDAGQKVFGDLTAAEEAQYEPFRKILTGDKLSLYTTA